MNRSEMVEHVLGDEYSDEDFQAPKDVIDYIENKLDDVISELECNHANDADKVVNALGIAKEFGAEIY